MGPVLGGLPPFINPGKSAPSQSTGASADSTADPSNPASGDGQGMDNFFALVAAMLPQMCQATPTTPQLTLADASAPSGTLVSATTATPQTAMGESNALVSSGADGLSLPALTFSPWAAWNAPAGPNNSPPAQEPPPTNVAAPSTPTVANNPVLATAPELDLNAPNANQPAPIVTSFQNPASVSSEPNAAPGESPTALTESATPSATAPSAVITTRIETPQTPASAANEKRTADFAPNIGKAERPTKSLETETIVDSAETTILPPETSSQTAEVASSKDEEWEVVGEGGVDVTAEHAAHTNETAPADASPRETVTPANLAERVGQRVAEQLPALRERGHADIQMSVHPPELGKIEIHLTLRDGNMHVQMTVQDDTVKRLLDQQLEPLRVRMNELGVGIGQFDVRRDGGSPNQNFEQDMESAAASAMIRKHAAASSVAAAYGGAQRSTALLDVFA